MGPAWNWWPPAPVKGEGDAKVVAEGDAAGWSTVGWAGAVV
jgi:hypothetical protein